MAPEVLEGAQGGALADRADWSPPLREGLGPALHLLTPFRSKTYETEPWPFLLKRGRMETVIAQSSSASTWLVSGPAHLCSRILRKVLSHTVAILLCQQHLPPLRLDTFITQ